ncbi:DUF6262 family protein [Nonomuraea jabiensis]|uniref:helix-turn-helix domain-containing protein n=1 Tax=Nonomuraea jabiensis TaxID=882448 RepID=UPI003D75A7B8
MAEPVTIGQRVKALRRSKYLSQAMLAQELKVSDSCISLIETGKRRPGGNTLKKIADFFEVPVAYLRHGTLFQAHFALWRRRTEAFDDATRMLARFFAECSSHDSIHIDTDTSKRNGGQAIVITLFKEPAAYLADLPTFDPSEQAASGERDVAPVAGAKIGRIRRGRSKSAAKTEAAEAAIKRLTAQGESVTFPAVQREAGVSLSFLYGHPQLRQLIAQLRRREVRSYAKRTPSSGRADQSILKNELGADHGERSAEAIAQAP